MKYMTRENYAYVLTAVILTGLSACVAVQPFPQAARAGDTITLAVGSPDDLKQTNTTVTYVPDSAPGTSVDLTPNIKSIFKLYPDKTSNVWLNQAAGIDSAAGHGAWMSVIAVNLPTSVPVGTGKVYVATTNATYPNFAHSVNDVPINMEILPGTGAPNPLKYLQYSWSNTPVAGQLNALKPASQVVIRMPPSSGGYSNSTTYGAVEVRIHMQMQDSSGLPLTDDYIAVVFDDQTQHLNSRIQSTWSRSGDDLLVTFVSPVGAMQSYEARCSIMVWPGYGSQVVGTPTLTSVKYFDVNGNPVSGPALELVSAL